MSTWPNWWNLWNFDRLYVRAIVHPHIGYVYSIYLIQLVFEGQGNHSDSTNVLCRGFKPMGKLTLFPWPVLLRIVERGFDFVLKTQGKLTVERSLEKVVTSRACLTLFDNKRHTYILLFNKESTIYALIYLWGLFIKCGMRLQLSWCI